MQGTARKLFISMILIVAAIGAGIKGYVHHQYKQHLDNSLRQLEVFALIRYTDFTTSLINGTLTLEKMTISSQFLPSELAIDKLIIQTPGPGYMIKSVKSLQNNDIPEKFGVRIEGFNFDLGDGLGDWLERMIKRVNPVLRPYQKLCGEKFLLGPKDWMEMGYTRLSSDMDINYLYNPSSQSLQLNLGGKTWEMGSFNLSLYLNGIAANNMMAFVPGASKISGDMEVRYSDESYVSRQVRYCAKLSNMEKAAYIEAEKNQPDEYFFVQWDASPGPGLREAYGEFLTDPRSVSLSMSFGSDFNPSLAHNYTPADLAQMLKMKVQVNDKNVDDLSFTLAPESFSRELEEKIMSRVSTADLLNLQSSADESTFKETEIPEFKRQEELKPKYYTIQLSQAEQFLGERIRINTRSGAEREGWLIKTDKNTLYVERRVHSGKFTMQVARDDVKKIEAWLIRK